jgi:hypothetical protein
VQRINADKRAYLHYFIDNERAAEVKALQIDDFNPNRVVFIQPGRPVPQEQLMRTYNWMVSWNLIDQGHELEDLVNTGVMTPA